MCRLSFHHVEAHLCSTPDFRLLFSCGALVRLIQNGENESFVLLYLRRRCVKPVVFYCKHTATHEWKVTKSQSQALVIEALTEGGGLCICGTVQSDGCNLTDAVVDAIPFSQQCSNNLANSSYMKRGYYWSTERKNSISINTLEFRVKNWTSRCFQTYGAIMCCTHRKQHTHQQTYDIIIETNIILILITLVSSWTIHASFRLKLCCTALI